MATNARKTSPATAPAVATHDAAPFGVPANAKLLHRTDDAGHAVCNRRIRTVWRYADAPAAFAKCPRCFSTDTAATP